MAEGGRVPGTVGQEHAVGTAREHLGRRGRRRDDLDVRETDEIAQGGRLDPEVVGDDGESAPGTLHAGKVRRAGRDLGDEVHAECAGLRLRSGEQLLFGGGPERAGHCAGLTHVAGQPAGVDAGEPRHREAAEESLQALRRAPAARPVGEVPDDHASAERAAALVVLGGHAVVADVRVGERQHLPRVGGIGDHFLVARHARVEDELPAGDPAVVECSHGLALEHGTIGEREPSRKARVSGPGAHRPGPAHRCASPSMTTASPANTVWRTLPVSRRPA